MKNVNKKFNLTIKIYWILYNEKSVGENILGYPKKVSNYFYLFNSQTKFYDNNNFEKSGINTYFSTKSLEKVDFI